MTARAKWDAWDQMAKDYEGRVQDAEERYLEIATSLGWREGDNPVASSSHGVTGDEEGEEGEEGRTSEGMGMGVSVSVMSAPMMEADDAGTLHGLVVENDLDALTTLVANSSTIDVNAKDDYVRAISNFLHVPNSLMSDPMFCSGTVGIHTITSCL